MGLPSKIDAGLFYIVLLVDVVDLSCLYNFANLAPLLEASLGSSYRWS